MASYMRERSVDALLILRNENKWAMTGNFLYFSLTFFLILFLIDSFLQCGYYVVCSFLVADVEVKGDGVFIRRRRVFVRTRTPLREFLPVMSASLWLRRFLNVAVLR